MANNNNTKNLNVPTLRFPEFTGEWKLVQLSQIADFVGGGTPSSSNASFWNGSIPWISSSDIKDGNIYDISITRFITKEAIDKSTTKLCPAPVILLVSRVGVGKVALSNKKLCTSQDFCNLINIKCNPNFLAYDLVRTMKQKSREAQGTSIKGVTSYEIQKIRFWLPEKKKEQDKIATFLSLLDHRIATQNKIIEKYESLIKGIGNKLFSFKMRFKTNDGNDFPSWKTKSFENIGKTFSGLSGKAKEDFGIGKPYIQYKQVFDTPQIQIQNCGLVNVLDSENQNNVKYGDILFTVSSETPDEIGMSSVLLDEVDEMYLNSFCFGYRLSSFEVLNPLYASYFFRDSSFRNKVVKIAQGSTRYNISKSEFIKLKISLPCIEEQARIASFLSAVDEKIKEEKEILALYLIQKNHLLRQMVI